MVRVNGGRMSTGRCCCEVVYAPADPSRGPADNGYRPTLVVTHSAPTPPAGVPVLANHSCCAPSSSCIWMRHLEDEWLTPFFPAIATPVERVGCAVHLWLRGLLACRTPHDRDAHAASPRSNR